LIGVADDDDDNHYRLSDHDIACTGLFSMLLNQIEEMTNGEVWPFWRNTDKNAK